MALLLSAGSLSMIHLAEASPDIVFGDSSDGIVYNTGLVLSAAAVYFVGDDASNQYFQALVKFSLGLVSKCLSSASLNLYVFQSILNDVVDNSGSLTNPGLGDLQVRHINDYGTLDAGDFDAPSIGNDPGVLIGGSATPNVGYVSITVTDAMQDDINNARSFTSYLLKLQTNTDNDGRDDSWALSAVEQGGTSQDPFIEYTTQPCPAVGGEILSVGVSSVILAWFLLVAVLAVGAIEVIRIGRNRKRSAARPVSMLEKKEIQEAIMPSSLD